MKYLIQEHYFVSFLRRKIRIHRDILWTTKIKQRVLFFWFFFLFASFFPFPTEYHQKIAHLKVSLTYRIPGCLASVYRLTPFLYPPGYHAGFLATVVSPAHSCCSVTLSCPALCNSMDCSTPGFPVLPHLLEFAQTHVHRVSDATQPSCPLLIFNLLPLPSVFPSIRVFSSESALHIRWQKYWSFSFSFSISPSNEHPGLISFRMDWLDLLAVQGTLKSLLQHFSSKTSILQHSAFFMVQLPHLYVTTAEIIAFTIQTFRFSLLVLKCMSIPTSQGLIFRNLTLELRECQVNFFPVTSAETYKISRTEWSFLTIQTGKLRNQAYSHILQ